MPYLGPEEVRSLLRPRDAVEALERALVGGLDPDAGPGRTIFGARTGHLLLMPAQTSRSVGVKLASVVPGNDARGLPRIQGLFVLMDGETLSPIALVDGASLTTLRTPAVSLAAVHRHLMASGHEASPRAGRRKVVVFGTSVQGVGHVETLLDVLDDPEAVEQVTFVRRRPSPPVVTLSGGRAYPVLRVDDAATAAALSSADIVICATSAPSPIFDSNLLKEDVVVIAVGSHEPHKRELDGALLRRGQIVVEDRATALREAGDVILAIDERMLAPDDLIEMADLVRGNVTLRQDRPVVFKSTGMAWQDVAVGEALFDRWRQRQS